MKRALAFTFAALLFGVAGLAQISGTFSGKIYILDVYLPPITAPYIDDVTLTINYSVAGFDLSSTSTFDYSGWTEQSFGLKGAVGPFNVEGSMAFDPAATPPAYKKAKLETSLDFAGLAITATINHWAAGYLPDNWDDYCQTVTTALMLYEFETVVEPLTVDVTFADCCTGIKFHEIVVSLSDLSLCCGITYDIEVAFNKAGFEYAKFSFDNLFELCCGITFGLNIEFTTQTKSVAPYFTWGGIKGCVEVWGDVMDDGNIITGWELYGFKLYCELAECNSIEIVESWYNEEVNKHLPAKWKLAADENELIKVSACGPACCGGNWSFTAGFFFGSDGGLFDITRMKFNAEVPLNDALTLDFGWVYANVIPGFDEVFVGWTFNF